MRGFLFFKRMANIVLTKNSNENEIKAYFNAVLRLTESREEFPVNLDEVWPLVYPRKDHAVRGLKENFIEGIDYQTLPKNGEQDSPNNWGGNNKVDYFLTVPCMEFFIARKVRPVFEVYRQVFHRAAEQVKLEAQRPQTLKLSEKLMWVREVKKLLNLNEASTLQLLDKLTADPDKLPLPDYTPSKGVLKSATELLKMHNIQGVTAHTFNLQALLKGFLCEQTRKASGGNYKSFKVITEKGKPYGENQVSPKNPRETQPLWYEDKFGELLKELGIESINADNEKTL